MTTCADAVASILMGGSGHPLSSSHQMPSFHDTNGEEAAPLARKFSAFEYQSLLRGAGVFVPSSVLAPVFARAISSGAGKDDAGIDDPLGSLTLAEIDSFVSSCAGSRGDIPARAWGRVLADPPAVFSFVAGWLLVVGLLPIPSSARSIIGKICQAAFSSTLRSCISNTSRR